MIKRTCLMGAQTFILLVTLSNATAGTEDLPSADPPPVFQPNEIQHGFAEYQTLPDFSSDNDPAPDEKDLSSPTVPSTDQKPGGLFQSLDFSESVEEDRTIRRGHVYVPVNSTTTFFPEIPSVYLVFSVHKHLSSYQIIGRLFHESGPGSNPSHLVDEESAELATEDESGFLKFFPPNGTWQSGRYRVDIYVGYMASPMNKMGSMHFTVASSSMAPSAQEPSGG
jgi:hypothetical protein